MGELSSRSSRRKKKESKKSSRKEKELEILLPDNFFFRGYGISLPRSVPMRGTHGERQSLPRLGTNRNDIQSGYTNRNNIAWAAGSTVPDTNVGRNTDAINNADHSRNFQATTVLRTVNVPQRLHTHFSSGDADTARQKLMSFHSPRQTANPDRSRLKYPGLEKSEENSSNFVKRFPPEQYRINCIEPRTKAFYLEAKPVEFTPKFSVKAELNRLKAVKMPDKAFWLYHGRGIHLPKHHLSLKPQRKLPGNADSGDYSVAGDQDSVKFLQTARLTCSDTSSYISGTEQEISQRDKYSWQGQHSSKDDFSEKSKPMNVEADLRSPCNTNNHRKTEFSVVLPTVELTQKEKEFEHLLQKLNAEENFEENTGTLANTFAERLSRNNSLRTVIANQTIKSLRYGLRECFAQLREIPEKEHPDRSVKWSKLLKMLERYFTNKNNTSIKNFDTQKPEVLFTKSGIAYKILT